MSIADWMLFAYVNILAILFYKTYTEYVKDDVNDYYEDEDRFTDSLQRGDMIKPDSKGILAEFKDADGTKYVAVLVQKDAYLKGFKEQSKEENDANRKATGEENED